MNAGEPIRRPSRVGPRPSHQPSTSTSSAPQQQVHDGFYGHEDTAKICASYVASTFSCPENPPPPVQQQVPGQPAPTAPPPAPPLANFIAYALHRTRLHSCVTFTALFLLQRLKTRFPAARGSSGHRLFISAFMIASKVVCDDTYSNKSWCVVGQGMFSLKEINQMEREMCSYLEWKLNFEPTELAQFEARVRRDYGSTSTARSASISRPAVAPIDTTTTRNKSSYPSPPDSPNTPATLPSPVSATRSHPMTPPSDAVSSRSSLSSVSSMFSTQTASTHATSVSAASSYIPKSGEPGYAFVSRSVW